MSSGRVAKAGSTVHTRVTNRNPSRVCSSRGLRRVSVHTSAPVSAVKNIASAWASSPRSRSASDTASGRSMVAAKIIVTTLTRWSTTGKRLMGGACRSQEAGADLEELLHARQGLLVHDEHDDVVAGADLRVMVGHEHVLAPHHGPDRRSRRQRDFLDAPIGDAR